MLQHAQCPLPAETGLETCAQVQLSDTQLFVEVLTKFCEDPRDLAQCRLSEKRLQAELQRLQSQVRRIFMLATTASVHASPAKLPSADCPACLSLRLVRICRPHC